MAKEIEGIIPAVITPFDENEEISEPDYRRVINFLLDAGVNGILPAGSQGEFFALTMDEKKRVIDIAVDEVNGRAFVMPNTGAITTRDSVALTSYAEAAGADAVSIITPFFISPSQHELEEHFRAICGAVRIPVFCYNNPDRTGGVALTPPTLARMSREIPNFAGIKDSSGDLTQLAEMIRLCAPGFKVMIGRDTLIFGALMYGAAGAIAATANVAPEIVAGIYRSYKAGDLDKSREYQQALAPLRIAFGLGSFPVVVKEAMEMREVPAGRCRRPILPMSDDKRAQLRKIMEEMGLAKA